MVEPQPAFQSLLALAQLSQSQAKGLPSQIDITPHWSGIGFELLGQKFVAPMGEVSEMLEVPPFTRLPDVKAWVMGVANVRGRLLPIYDLAGFFNESLSADRKQHRILVLEIGDVYAGLLVDRVFGMQHLPVDTLDKESDYKAPNFEPFLDGCYRHEDLVWNVFMSERLTRNEAFMDVSAEALA